jgi:hypothetical protein
VCGGCSNTSALTVTRSSRSLAQVGDDAAQPSCTDLCTHAGTCEQQQQGSYATPAAQST